MPSHAASARPNVCFLVAGSWRYATAPADGWSTLVVTLLAVGVLGFLGVAGYVYWIYRDAALRGSGHPVVWAVGAFVLGPLVLLVDLPDGHENGASRLHPHR